MAHQEGWIDLYEHLERGEEPPRDLVTLCMRSRTATGETMLHWYALEGSPFVLKRLIDLGFDVNVQDEFGQTPLMGASLIERWDNVQVLLENGARLDLRDREDQDYFAFMKEYEIEVPEWVTQHVQITVQSCT